MSPRLPPAVDGSGSGPRQGERGVGVIGTTAGVAAFLVFLLFAVQLSFNLYATSAVNAAGLDAARTVAARDLDHTDSRAVAAARVRAEGHARQLLGRYGDRARFDWQLDADEVRVRVRVPNPHFLPDNVARPIGFDEVDRTMTVRVEQFR